MPDVRIQDFSGGETDRYRDGGTQFCRLAQNLYVSENKHLMTRPGYGSLHPTDTRPWGDQEVSLICEHWLSPTDYDSFVFSITAVRASLNGTGALRTISAADGGNLFFNAWNINDPLKYTRISSSEFLIMSKQGNRALKFYRESSVSEWKYVLLGLPRYDSIEPPVVKVGNTNTWNFALVLRHEYTTYAEDAGQTTTKLVRGEPYFWTIEADTITSISIPAFSSGSLFRYVDNQGTPLPGSSPFDFTNVRFELYRTTNNGSVFYLLDDDVTPGTTYNDAHLPNDTFLTGNAILYTTGGIQGNAMPSLFPSYATFANGTLWTASTREVWQHKIGIPDASPGSFVFRVKDGEYITSLESIDIYPIVSTNLGMYRVEGTVDDLGRGTHRVRLISETDGSLSHKTLVKADNKIYYWNSSGIYETNGYQSNKVSNHYNDTYKEIVADVNDVKKFVGCWDDVNRRLHWFYHLSGNYNNLTLTMDLKYRHQEGYNLQRGTVPYDVTYASCPDGLINIVTENGMVLTQDTTLTADLDPDNDPDDNNGISVPVLWDYVGCSLSFGTDLFRKWFSRVLFEFTNHGPLTAEVLSDTDESDDWRNHNSIFKRGVTRGLYFVKRWFPRGTLRGTYKAIRVTNAEDMTIYRSDDYDTGDITGASVTLNSGVWPEIFPGQRIGFGPTYSPTYRINTSGGGVVINLDVAPGNANDQDWHITGAPQNEKIELNSYTVIFKGGNEGHAQDAPSGVANE